MICQIDRFEKYFKEMHSSNYFIRFFLGKAFFSILFMRKPLSSDLKWFLRPYFPLIGGIFVLKSDLVFFVLGIGSAHSESEVKPPFSA